MKKKETYHPAFGALRSVPEKTRQLRTLLEALIVMNVSFLVRHKEQMGKNYPSIYDVAPKYGGPAELGIWQDISHTALRGVGDACDLVCWRVAELRAAGYKDARPLVKTTKMEDGLFFTTVQVQFKDMLEDPTAILA
jgi:hypothetical protein